MKCKLLSEESFLYATNGVYSERGTLYVCGR